MANRLFNQFPLSLEKGLVALFGNVAIGATGAPTMNATKSKGILSVTRNSAGKYTIALADKYQYLIGANFNVVLASGAPATSSSVQAVIRSDASNTTPAVIVEFVDNAGAAIELANGAVVLFELKLKNSVV